MITYPILSRVRMEVYDKNYHHHLHVQFSYIRGLNREAAKDQSEWKVTIGRTRPTHAHAQSLSKHTE